MRTPSDLDSSRRARSRSWSVARPAGSVELTLPARPESVARARREVGALGERLGLSELRMHDLRTVVSEACMNAAVHAYDGGVGDIHVLAAPHEEGLTLTVSDRGAGITPRPAYGLPTARLGILLMAALTSSLEISRRPGGGTRFRMCFGADAPTTI